jgi:hypothetical protein
MKRINWLLGILMLGLIFSACQKETDVDGAATGKFKKDAAGNCTPIAINGIFRVDSILGNEQYVDVQVISDNIGTFDIKTDTINGFAFSKKGTIGLGLNTIRLFAGGKPLAAGTSTFTVEFGTSICTFDVTVFGTTSGTAAIYTLGGAPAACTGFTLGGAYNAGVAADPITNFVNFVVNVTTLGTYNISTNTVNGLTFSGTGVFTTTGIQGVTLKAAGVPAATGNFNYLVSVPTGTCSFSVTVGSSGAPTSVYSLGGSPGSCTGAVVAGTYQQGVPVSGATATISVNVTTAGTYAISTTPVNGVTFAGSGTFAGTGTQTVVLTGSGTPTGSGNINHTVTATSGNCSFSVTYAPPPPPAAYTIDCPGINVSGTYINGVALGASNNVTIPVNITTPGQYTLTTTLNGMTFSQTGVFAAAGFQTVTLPGTGTPTVTGVNTFTINGTSGSCTFDVQVDPAPVPSDLKWQFTVGATTYQGDCTAIQFSPDQMLVTSTSGGNFQLTLTNATGSISTGSYSGTSTAGKYVSLQYNLTTFFSVPGSGFTNLSANVTTYNTTTNIIEGTFSGTVINGSASTFTVTNGKFKAQF